METTLICVIIFFSALVRGLSGFAFALLAMPLLTQITDLHVSITLVALLQLITSLILLVHYRKSFNLKAVFGIAIASLIAVPLGVLVSSRLEERLIMALLGVLITLYALYSLFSPRLPEIKSAGWGYVAGFISGFLGGAYNTGAPPLILYGNCCQWNQEEFKSNIQGIRILSVVLTVISHGVNQNITPEVWRHFFFVLPSLFFGIGFGIFLSKRLNPNNFRQIILILLLGIGLKLLF